MFYKENAYGEEYDDYEREIEEHVLDATEPLYFGDESSRVGDVIESVGMVYHGSQ